MILFLDTVSSLPEFFLIEDNKIISSKKIINEYHEKMSDCIVSQYLELNREFLLSKKLTNIIVNTGPGSYTALRVGIAFVSGLSISQKIDLKGFSCIDLFRYSINCADTNSSAFLIFSSNDQNFFCFYNDQIANYDIHKIENDKQIQNLMHKNLKKIYTNEKIDNKILYNKNIKYEIIGFEKVVSTNLKKILKLPKQSVINPIYISNNKILN